MALFTYFSVLVFQYLSLTTPILSESPPCTALIPDRVFRLNKTLHECFYPLEDDSSPSCEIGEENLDSFPRCVDNAMCVRNPRPWGASSPTICTCQRNFKMTGLYTCDPAKQRAEQCQTRQIGGDERFTIDNCDVGLFCIRGSCQCQLESDDGACLLSSGAPCSVVSTRNQTQRCIPNSICVLEIGSESGTCECTEGYINRGAQYCVNLLGSGENCDDDDSAGTCNEMLGLSCQSGTCQCELRNSDNSNFCAIKIGRSCALQGAKCTKDAACIEGVCKCNAGYEEADSGSGCQRLALFGENCQESDTKCDYISGLTCFKGRCECEREKSTDGKVCILAANDQCSVKNDKARCPPNSFCKIEGSSGPDMGQCRCDDGFIMSYDDSKCHKILEKGETCFPGKFQYLNFCNEKLGLSCMRIGSQSACTCPVGELSAGKCKIRIGQRCELGQSYPVCPSNSTCEGHGDYKRCKCLENFTSNYESLSCIPERKYMATCGEGSGVCTNELKCLQGLCQCPRPSDQIFDPELSHCKSRGSCEYDSDCPSRSSCKPLYAGSATKWCTCNKGYAHDARKLCKSKYLTKCSKRDDCLTSKSMDCIDGVCKCSAMLNQIYDANQEECVGLLKSPCGTGNRKCISGTYCSPLGVCICDIGAYEVENGKCANLRNFGSSCSLGTTEIPIGCDWNKGLACMNGACACVDPNLRYVANNQTGGTCLAKTGSLCNLKIPVGECTEPKQGEYENVALSFQSCNYYKIPCESGSICQDIGNGLHRCRA